MRGQGVRFTREAAMAKVFATTVEQRITELLQPWRGDRVRALHRIRRTCHRSPDPPALRPAELDDEDVVEVEVQVEPAGI